MTMTFHPLLALERWFLPPRRDVPPDGPASPTEVIRDAIRSKKQITAYRRKCFLVFCPHALASSARGLYVLAFVILGGTLDDDDLRSPSRWRWIRVSRLTDVMERRGFWFSASRDSRPKLPAATIELDVA